MILQDPRLRLAFVITGLISGAIIIITRGQDPEDMLPVVLGLGLLMAGLQMWILFGWSRQSAANRLLAARQQYLRGDFETAAELLEALTEEDPSPDALALLGNTYRQMGKLDRSADRLEKAVEQAPDNVQALFGLGRTRMVQGNYAEAAQWLDKALQNGGRKAIRADLALALHLQAAPADQIITMAQSAARVLNLEQYRTLFINYLLYNLVQDDQSAAYRIMQHNAGGLDYWQTEARRHANSDYGRRIAGDVVEMRAILQKEARG